MNTREYNALSSFDRNEVLRKMDKINLTLVDLIDSIVEIDENTLGIKLAKNIVIYNEGSCVTINKGYNVQVAKEIHLNPSKPLDDSINNMLDFEKE